MLAIIYCLLLVRCASAQPIFSDGVATVMSSLAERQARFTSPAKDDVTKVESLKTQGADRLQHDLITGMDRTELAKFAYEIVHVRMLKMKFLGGCPRNFGDCPAGWANSSKFCEPPASYEGLCGHFALRGAPSKLVEDFAWRCKADFPCRAACEKFRRLPSSMERHRQWTSRRARILYWNLQPSN